MKWLDLVKLLAPIILASNSKTARLAPYVSVAVGEAEALKGARGAEKLTHSIAIVRAGIAGTNAAAGRTVIEPDLSDALIGHAVSTVVDATNLIKFREGVAP